MCPCAPRRSHLLLLQACQVPLCPMNEPPATAAATAAGLPGAPVVKLGLKPKVKGKGKQPHGAGGSVVGHMGRWLSHGVQGQVA